MENQVLRGNQNGKPLIILGFIAIAVVIIVYGKYQNPEFVTPDAIDDFQRMANGFYIIMLLAFGAVAFGLFRYQKYKIQEV